MTVLSYYPGVSFLHRLDPRMKIAAGIMTSWLLFQPGNTGAIVAAVLILVPITVLLSVKAIPLSAFLRYLKVFAPLILLILLSSLLGVNRRENFMAAAGFSSRLGLAVLGSAMFTSATPVTGIKKSVVWLLRPFPFIPAHRIGLMTGLAITMVPRLLKIFDDIRDALAARCIANRKNPVIRMRLLVVPMLIAVSTYVEDLAQAMEARCFSEKRREAPFSLKPFDWVWLAVHFVPVVLVATEQLDFF